MLGPVDFVVVGFNGNNFDGSIVKELTKAVDSGAIRLIDLLFIIKDKEGNVLAAEIQDQYDELKAAFEPFALSGDMPLLTEDDMEKISADMENDTTAGVLIFEQLWALGLKKAILDAGGILLDEGRIHPEALAAALDELESLAE